MQIKLPCEYIMIGDLLPEQMGMPKETIGYQMVNEGTNGLIFCFDVEEKYAMPFEVATIIESQHRMMQEYEGLVEADSGITKNRNKYAYVIIKHPLTAENGDFIGTEYTMNVNIKMGNKMKFLNASFVEAGTTGIRDATVFSMLRESSEVGANMEGWQEDPYDNDYKYGFLMNLSEKKEYDVIFPYHPLSEERKLVRYIIENN